MFTHVDKGKGQKLDMSVTWNSFIVRRRPIVWKSDSDEIKVKMEMRWRAMALWFRRRKASIAAWGSNFTSTFNSGNIFVSRRKRSMRGAQVNGMKNFQHFCWSPTSLFASDSSYQRRC